MRNGEWESVIDKQRTSCSVFRVRVVRVRVVCAKLWARNLPPVDGLRLGSVSCCSSCCSSCCCSCVALSRWCPVIVPIISLHAISSAALASGFILPTSLSAIWLVFQVFTCQRYIQMFGLVVQSLQNVQRKKVEKQNHNKSKTSINEKKRRKPKQVKKQLHSVCGLSVCLVVVVSLVVCRSSLLVLCVFFFRGCLIVWYCLLRPPLGDAAFSISFVGAVAFPSSSSCVLLSSSSSSGSRCRFPF